MIQMDIVVVFEAVNVVVAVAVNMQIMGQASASLTSRKKAFGIMASNMLRGKRERKKEGEGKRRRERG